MTPSKDEVPSASPQLSQSLTVPRRRGRIPGSVARKRDRATTDAPTDNDIADADTFTLREEQDGPLLRGLPPACSSAVSWSPHNVLAVATRESVNFYLHDCQQPLAQWNPHTASRNALRGATADGIRQVLWAPDIFPGPHYPVTCWVAVRTDAGVFVTCVQRVGENGVIVQGNNTQVVLPRQKPLWWVQHIAWVDATHLAILLPDSILDVDVDKWCASADRVSSNSAQHNSGARRQQDRERASDGSASSASDEDGDEGEEDDDNSDDDDDDASKRNASSAKDSDSEDCGDEVLPEWLVAVPLPSTVQLPFDDTCVVLCPVTERTTHPAASSCVTPYFAVLTRTHLIILTLSSPPVGCAAARLSFHSSCLLPAAMLLSSGAPLHEGVCAFVLHRPTSPPPPPTKATTIVTSKRQEDTSASALDFYIAVVLASPFAICQLALRVASASIEAVSLTIIPQVGVSSVTRGGNAIVSVAPLMVKSDVKGAASLNQSASSDVHDDANATSLSEAPAASGTLCATITLMLVGLRCVQSLSLPPVEFALLRKEASDADPFPITTVMTVDDAAAGTSDSRTCCVRRVWFQCPRVHGISFPRAQAAIHVVSVSMHSSMHLMAMLVRVADFRKPGLHLQLLLHSTRDVNASPAAAALHALGAWAHYGSCVTTYLKDRFVAREYIFRRTQSIRQTAYYHERFYLLTTLGAGVDRRLLQQTVAHVDSGFVDEAGKTFDSLVAKFLAYRAKHGVELVTRFGWTMATTSSTSFHWRATLLTLLRFFRLSCVAVELTLGRALTGLRMWLRWSQQGYRSAAPAAGSRSSNTPQSTKALCAKDASDSVTDSSVLRPPSFIGPGFSCRNAEAFVRAYRMEFAATPPLTSIEQSGHHGILHESDIARITSAILLPAKSEKDRLAFVQQLDDFLKALSDERARTLSHAATLQYWSSSASLDDCSVCCAPLSSSPTGDDELLTLRRFPLTLVDHRRHCGTRADADAAQCTHSTVYSPVTFRSLCFYAPSGDVVITQCSSCGVFVEVTGATCDLCEGFLS